MVCSGEITLFYDLSKAFDCIDYGFLVAKLGFYGIIGNCVKLIESFLRGHQQIVCVGQDR